MALTIRQGNTKPPIKATLKNADGTAIVLTATTVKFIMSNSVGAVVINRNCTIVNTLTGEVQFDWNVGETSIVGSYSAEFRVIYADTRELSVPNDSFIVLDITPALV